MGAALPFLRLRPETGGPRVTRGGVVLTVNGDRDVVERQLLSGGLCCPSCGGVLGGWGNAAERRIRVLDGPDVVLVPRRSRCRACRGTHVLLPARVLSPRAWPFRAGNASWPWAAAG